MVPVIFILVSLLILSTSATDLPFVSRQCPVVIAIDAPFRQISDRVDIGRAETRIVGGDFVTSRRLNSLLVSLTPNDFSALCTGTLISPFWVISAAHCRINRTWLAALGATQAVEDGRLVGIRRVFNHPLYMSTRRGDDRFDISVMRLRRRARIRNFMSININPAVPQEGSFVRIAGYGTIVFEQPEPPRFEGRLRQVDVPVSPNLQCRTLFGTQDDAQFCAGYPQGGCDSCQGDSGGPLFQYDAEGNPVLVGLVSFGSGCGDPGSPGVNVRVSFHARWMARQGARFRIARNLVPVFGG